MLDRIKTWFKHSLTIFWARLLVFCGIVLTITIDVSSDPTVNAAIQSILGKYGLYWLIGIGIVTELVRRRTVGKPTDANNQIIGID